MSDKSGVKKQKKSTKKSAKKSEKSTVSKQKKTVEKEAKSPKEPVKTSKGKKSTKSGKPSNKQSLSPSIQKVDKISDGIYIGIELDEKYLIQKFHPITITNEGKEDDDSFRVEILKQNLILNHSEIISSKKQMIDILSEKISEIIKIPIVVVLNPSEKVEIPKFEPFLLKKLLDTSSPYGIGSKFNNFDDPESEQDTSSQIIDLIESLNKNIKDVYDNQFSYRI